MHFTIISCNTSIIWFCLIAINDPICFLQNALRKRDQFQLEYEVTMEDLNKRRKEKEEVEFGTELSRFCSAFFQKSPIYCWLNIFDLEV